VKIRPRITPYLKAPDPECLQRIEYAKEGRALRLTRGKVEQVPQIGSGQCGLHNSGKCVSIRAEQCVPDLVCHHLSQDMPWSGLESLS